MTGLQGRKAVTVVALVVSLLVMFVVGASLVAQQGSNRHTPKGAYKTPGPSKQTQAEIRAIRAQQLLGDYGTQISPCRTAVGDELDLQEDICAAFWDQDPEVPGRKKMFDWCYADPEMRVAGWFGIIEKLSVSDQQCIVEVKVSPRLVRTRANVLYTTDHCIETWSFRSGRLNFVKAKKNREPAFLFGD